MNPDTGRVYRTQEELDAAINAKHEELKPCPFCGEVPKLGDNGGAGGEFWSQINCESPKCEIQPYAQCFGKPDLAIKDWNTRAPASASDRATIAAQAERITSLEMALRSIAANTCCESCQEAALVARVALAKAKEKA